MASGRARPTNGRHRDHERPMRSGEPARSCLGGPDYDCRGRIRMALDRNSNRKSEEEHGWIGKLTRGSCGSPIRITVIRAQCRWCCYTGFRMTFMPMTRSCHVWLPADAGCWCLSCVVSGRPAFYHPRRFAQASRPRWAAICWHSWMHCRSRVRCLRVTTGAGARPAWWPPCGRIGRSGW